jgi:hypothetical protein
MTTKLVRRDGRVIAEYDVAAVRDAVRLAVAQGLSLAGACLSGTDISGARLAGAYLSGADLSRARLSGADLSRARLAGADLRGADLYRARLSGADLSGADLAGARLVGAEIRGVDLAAADLHAIRDDIWSVLAASPHEVPALLAAHHEGRIDGLEYEGQCCCLIGTLDAARRTGEVGDRLPRDVTRPAEMWYRAIRPGHTPATSQVAALAVRWIEEWIADRYGEEAIP